MQTSWNFQKFLLEHKNSTETLENSLIISYKLNIVSSYDSAIPLLGIYPKMKTYVHTKTCIEIFMTD